MGYSQESATRAIFSCGPISVDGLVEWITEHRGDPDINTPLLVPTMPKWTNLVTDEMKIRSQKIREQAVWKANQRKDNRNRNRRETITMNAPNLYSRRLLKDLKTLSDKRREELKREFFIVEDMDDHILEDEIDQALEQCDPNMGEFSFELPSRSDSAYVYSDELMQICLKRDKTYTCSTKSKKHRQKAKRIGLTFLLVKGLIKRGEAIRLRWVYYLDPVTYGDQNNSNEAVACMSLICGATRSSFHIRPSPRGSILGPVLLCMDDNIIVNCTLGTFSGSKIPSEAEIVNRIIQVSAIDFILIVEKDTVFHKLADIDFASKFNCVMVTASGEPDVATRIVLHKLRRWLDVPVCALVDGNVEGFDIMCTYRFGSVNRAYDNLSLTLPDLKWIGVFPQDVDEKYLVPFSDKELRKLQKAIDKPHVRKDTDWRTGLMSMLQKLKKADIEAVARDCRLDEYIMKRVRPLLS
ncbi:unnamed protein product [Urochloa humidicola]